MPRIHLVIYFFIYCQLPEGIVSVKDYVDASNPVTIDDTNYSMVELPGSETQVVADERRKILQHIDLKSFQQDLGYVGRCIQLANYGMVAAGRSKLQIEIERLGGDVTRLCAKSANAVSTFKTESTMILTDLQAMYGYLLDGPEERALETLSSATNIAGQFAKAAEELHNSFDEKAHKVQQIVENTQETEAEEENTATQAEMDWKDREMTKESKRQRYLKAQKEKEKAEWSFFNSEIEERKAIQNLTYEDERSLIAKILECDSEHEKRVKKYEALHQNKTDARQIKTEKEEKEEQVYESMTELVIELQHYESKVESAKSSAEALHAATEGLKPLKANMMKSADFWNRMQEHCKALSDSKLRDKVEKQMHEISDEQRLKSWISLPFKRQVISFNAGWVALDGILDEYMGSIKETQKELYKYIQESPTQEEAKKNIHSLAAKFQRDLQNAQMACTKEDSECRG